MWPVREVRRIARRIIAPNNCAELRRRIAHLELLLRDRHLPRKIARRVVAPPRQVALRLRRIRQPRARPRQPGARRAARREVVLEPPRRVRQDVDHEDLVGQVQQQVALVGVALLRERHLLELEGEVVAERAVQPELRVVVDAHQLAQRAHHREDRVLARALLLGEAALDLAHAAAQRRALRLQLRHARLRLQHLAHRRQQHAAARVERRHRERAAPRLEHERRVDEAHRPPRVPARELVRRLEDAAALRVELVDHALERRPRVQQLLHLAVHRHAAARRVAPARVRRPRCAERARRRRRAAALEAHLLLGRR